MGMTTYILLLFIVGVDVARVEYPTSGPTVCPKNDFVAQADVNILEKAIKSLNVTEIIDVLAKRSNYQRLEIAKSYKEMYNVTLIDEFKKVMEEKRLRNLIVALMTPEIDYWVEELHNAIWHTGNNTDDDRAINHLLCDLNGRAYHLIPERYNERYNRSLESDLKNGAPQISLRRVYSARVAFQSENDPSLGSDQELTDAQKLKKTGVYQLMGTDDSPLNESILVTRPAQVLKRTFDKYKNISHNDIDNAIIESTYPDDIKKGLIAFVKCLEGHHQYFADSLHASFTASDHRDLERIIMLHSESNFNYIRELFDKRPGESFQKSMEERITPDDDYKYALLSLTNRTDPCVYIFNEQWDLISSVKKSL